MSKRKEEISGVEQAIWAQVADEGRASSGSVAERAGVTRQAAHGHLRRLVEEGRLVRTGQGRSSAYIPPLAMLTSATYARAGLEEHEVWARVRSELEVSIDMSPEAVTTLEYAVTEMVNNAIDHSQGSSVIVESWFEGGRVHLEVRDDGIGVFRNVRETFGLQSNLEALRALSKGKQTTAPEQHTGEGLFFTSKAVDRFELVSGKLAWVVEASRGDQAIKDLKEETKGTTVRLSVDPLSTADLGDLFRSFTDEDFQFSRSQATLALLTAGSTFISRSEARRLAQGLERFANVVVDFDGVNEVGQAFVDELFRVWATAHPQTTLEAKNMTPGVAFMVQRGLHPLDLPPSQRRG